MTGKIRSYDGDGPLLEGGAHRCAIISRNLKRRGITLIVSLVVLAGIAAAGCSSGTYPVDIFYEMHYQQSYGPHEPPRLSPPAGAVPITGVQISTGENPFEASPTVLRAGESIFAINCVFCHGAQGKADGPVLQTMKDEYGYGTDARPYTITPNLTDPFVAQQADAGLFGWVTNGVTVMPSFRKLLSVDERWQVVSYIRACLIEGNPDCP